MSAPETYPTDSDTLIVEPVAPLGGGRSGANGTSPSAAGSTGEPVTESISVIRSGSRQGAPGERRRFTELDGLRGLAALLVVVFHLRRHLRDLDGVPDVVLKLLSGGYLMVDLFFVISGFVLARSMLATRTRADFTRFSTMRVRRFMPLHLAGMGVVFGCTMLTWLVQQIDFVNAPRRPAFTTQQESIEGYLSAIALTQGFIGPHFAGYAAAWSLSIELWTNILLVAAIALMPWPRYKALVGPIAMLAGAVMLMVAVGGENSLGPIAFGRGLFGLGAGMGVYWLYTTGLHRGWVRTPTTVSTVSVETVPVATVPLGTVQGGTGGTASAGTATATASSTISSQVTTGASRWPAVGGVAGLLALTACVYFARDLRPYQFIATIPVAAFLVFCLAQRSDGPAHRLLNTRVAQWLGTRSFALYALHGATLVSITLAARLRGLDLHAPKVAVAICVATLVGSLITAEIGHRFIERLWMPKKAR